MPTEKEPLDIKKAMAYDLLKILKKGEDKKYSREDLENLIDVYITGLEQ